MWGDVLKHRHTIYVCQVVDVAVAKDATVLFSLAHCNTNRHMMDHSA